MKLPALDTLGLNPGILTESMSGEDRLVLWLPAGEADGRRRWERVTSMPGTTRAAGAGIFTVRAALVPVRLQTQGRLGQLMQWWWTSDDANTWTVPGGEVAEPCGDKQTDLLLAWVAPTPTPLTEFALRELWPRATRLQMLGKHLALVGVVAAVSLAKVREDTSSPARGAVAATTEDTPAATASTALDAARRDGDRRQEATALVDVGLVHLDAGDVAPARHLFQQALNLAVDLGDRQVEGDACSGLGTIALVTGNPHEALPLFERELSAARQAKNRVAEKVALAHLGICHSALRSPEPALAAFEQALTLAREVGDRVHEAELLWHLAVIHAEVGGTPEAIARGQTAIDGYESMGMLEAKYLAGHLEKFRAAQAPLAAPAFVFGGSFVAGASMPPQAAPPANPGILRMALSGLSAVARFTGSGFQTTPEETRRRRLDTCRACEHHTGLRCRLCGCFTSVKARFPAERCPLAKWTE